MVLLRNTGKTQNPRHRKQSHPYSATCCSDCLPLIFLHFVSQVKPLAERGLLPFPHIFWICSWSVLSRGEIFASPPVESDPFSKPQLRWLHFWDILPDDNLQPQILLNLLNIGLVLDLVLGFVVIYLSIYLEYKSFKGSAHPISLPS